MNPTVEHACRPYQTTTKPHIAEPSAHHPIDKHLQNNALPNLQNYLVSGSVPAQTLA
jgi:hypothetical protein